ncbi:hypothetical protein [Tenacibaculum sp. 47A_GOM-205m]|uniref:hypothetical protein n=1 Tax=Tenacibaculum sp. 47A_GOM-205m TaxID=1380384 RepID=UPI000491A561|nr:hypothetical protein [Tenacibaculum sp. 47A_GOM-205m]
MKKSILNLGKALNKVEQKSINGSGDVIGFCNANGDCPTGSYCEGYLCIKDNSSGGGGNTGGGSGGGCTPDRFCVNEFDTCCIGY